MESFSRLLYGYSIRLSDGHVARYGKCAIGVTKSLVKKWGGNPVLYIVDRKERYEVGKRTDFRGIFGESVVAFLRTLAQGKLSPAAQQDPAHWAHALSPAQLERLRNDAGWPLATHLKELFDLGADIDGEDEFARRDRYYLEREWRVVLSPQHEQAAKNPNDFIAARENHHYLTPPRKEVRVVVMPNDRARAELLRRLQNDKWSPAELPAIITYADSRDL